MAERSSRQPPRKGEPRPPEHTDNATNQHPKGTPTEERHDTEVAGGQVHHDQPLTTEHPAGGEQNQKEERA